jgi:hypothetical protein
MPWPWRDLLFLHGYITDLELVRKLAELSPEKPPSCSGNAMTPGEPLHGAVATEVAPTR